MHGLRVFGPLFIELKVNISVSYEKRDPQESLKLVKSASGPEIDGAMDLFITQP